ncbi:hypothetical protein X736_20090 [Mesorhizobium sp. L2C089B000]|nr:hypothetical protein X736_20090 [Mesorhizobium sp. L2C089B000]
MNTFAPTGRRQRLEVADILPIHAEDAKNPPA